MDIHGGKIMFGQGEAAAAIAPVVGTPYEDMVSSIKPEATEADARDSNMLARALHEVIIDPDQPESVREEATNQLMQIALVGLRSSINIEKRLELNRSALDLAV